jgi:heat shock protein HtpX
VEDNLNTIKTTFLLAIMTSFFIFIGQVIGGQSGMFIAFVFAAVMNIASYWYSDKIVLKLHSARPINKDNSLHSSFEELLKTAEITGPKLYIYDSEEPNAFATGRNYENSVVAVSTKLVETLTTEEINGVLAHEIAHIENKDILIASIAATFAGAISMIASMLKWGLIFGAFRGNRDSGSAIGHLLIAILAPIIALIIQMAISRTREFKADYTAAQITKKPEHLASALKKISSYYSTTKLKSDPSPATSHMYIISPFIGGLGKLFSSHPPMEERVKRLEEISF